MVWLPGMKSLRSLIQNLRPGEQGNRRMRGRSLRRDLILTKGRKSSTKTKDIPSAKISARHKDEEVANEEILEFHPG